MEQLEVLEVEAEILRVVQEIYHQHHHPKEIMAVMVMAIMVAEVVVHLQQEKLELLVLGEGTVV